MALIIRSAGCCYPVPVCVPVMQVQALLLCWCAGKNKNVASTYLYIIFTIILMLSGSAM